MQILTIRERVYVQPVRNAPHPSRRIMRRDHLEHKRNGVRSDCAHGANSLFDSRHQGRAWPRESCFLGPFQATSAWHPLSFAYTWSWRRTRPPRNCRMNMFGYIGGFGFYDPLWFLFLLPGMLLGIYAQVKLSGTYGRYTQVPASTGL